MVPAVSGTRDDTNKPSENSTSTGDSVGLLKKKTEKAAAEQPAPQAETSKKGRSLFYYLLPAPLVAMALMVVLAFFAWQSIIGAATLTAKETAMNLAEGLALRLEGEVKARRDLMVLAASDGPAVNAFLRDDADQLQTALERLQSRLPGLMQLRLLSPDASQPDTGGPAPLGYAGLDQIRRAAQSGKVSQAEIHQIESGSPYLALAVPVKAGGRTLVMFGAWDMRPLIRVVESSPVFPGRLQLIQGKETPYALAKGPGHLELDDGGDGVVEVPGSIWKVAYGARADSGGLSDMVTVLALIGGGVLTLILSVALQWRMLGRDLKEDASAIVNLGEAILRRTGSQNREAHVGANSDAIALLSQYAREARVRGAAPMPEAPLSEAVPQAAPITPQSVSGLDVEEIDSDPAELLMTSGSAPEVDIAESLFRAYDIRGIVGETLTSPVAELIGRALATLVREQGGLEVAVASDARLSSPDLSTALIRGLVAGGCNVLDVGQAPTPLLYYAMQVRSTHAGVMVTGSHNPPEYNGLKIAIGDKVLDGDELKALRERMLEGRFSQGQGTVERIDLVGQYAEAVVNEVQLARPLKVVVDAGNGVAGDLAIATFEMLGCEVVPLFCEPDGNFPNHHPDPSQPDNLASLMLEVQAQEADIGLAFDGDGDRLGIVDNAGNTIWPDTILMLLASDILGRHPGVDILYDVKSSRHLASFILGHGGRPIMWKSGHSRMRAKMLETGALLGGEFSGHLFVKERWYAFDDAIYAAARVLEILALDPRPSSDLFAELPSSPSTPEYQLMLEEGQSRELMRAVDANKVFDDARLVELDGLRVEFGNGWGLIRPSNTTPSLTFRFEADDEGSLEEIKARFRDLLGRVAPDMQAPF